MNQTLYLLLHCFNNSHLARKGNFTKKLHFNTLTLRNDAFTKTLFCNFKSCIFLLSDLFFSVFKFLKPKLKYYKSSILVILVFTVLIKTIVFDKNLPMKTFAAKTNYKKTAPALLAVLFYLKSGCGKGLYRACKPFAIPVVGKNLVPGKINLIYHCPSEKLYL